jgi:hypothetical protein
MAEGAKAGALPGHGPVADVSQHVVVSSRRLLHATAGSISLDDATGDRYAQMAERGTSCHELRRAPAELPIRVS